MRILKFNVEKQQLSKDDCCDFSNIVSGSVGYLTAEFSFCNEWNGCKKVAVFEANYKQIAVPLKNNSCVIPDDAAACTSFTVYVIGARNSFKISTNKQSITQTKGE